MTKRKTTKLGIVHVTATRPGWNGGIAGLRAMHKARGFVDIGYNEVVDYDGTILKGRGIDQVGAHVAGYNSISYGIAMIGGLDSNGKADYLSLKHEQLDGLLKRMREVSVIYPTIEWCGHRDLSPDLDGDGLIEPHEWVKECPTFDVIPWAAKNGLKVAKINGSGWSHASLIKEAPDARTMWLQKLLVSIGYNPGPIDGIIGRKTRTAITGFQIAEMLPASGEFDTQTVKRLRERAGA